MPTPFRKLLLASSIAIATSLSSGAFAAAKPSQDVINARQESQIWTTYALSPFLRANDLAVTVENGKATLTGKVAEDVNKDLATEIAKGVSGIKSVDNQIVVQADYAPTVPSSTRTYGEVIEDATITSAVKSKLLWSNHTSSVAINVDTQRGKVTLSGTAESRVAKDLAGRLALNTRGVTSINNTLTINPDKPTAAETAKRKADKAALQVADSWITTKVKSTLLYSSNIDSNRISVTTSKGVVLLSGKVGSAVEHALAVELASNVRGVKRVQSKGLTL
ncbi:BON domain-containing protein [Perlucidibaca aquatica]|uniref:BON domain-containing protein n=1 Tax=Perlucidibaca aquatica TaxID=1852776 RepID=UPI00083B80AB|nr:BON domain-containing protein [Perlucidibaca aquatica]